MSGWGNNPLDYTFIRRRRVIGARVPATPHTAPTFVAAGAFNGGSINSVPPLPTGWAENDIFLIFCETQNQAIAAPSGWAHVTNSPQSIDATDPLRSTRLNVLWRRATASESAPTIIDSGDHTRSVMLAFRGCPTSGDPWDATAGATELTNGNGASFNLPSVTTSIPNTLVVLAASHGYDEPTVATFGSWANAGLSSVTERADGSHINGSGGGIGVATGVKATAGAVGTSTATVGVSSNSTGECGLAKMTIALKGVPS